MIDERNGRCYILTTDINNTCLTMDQFLTNYTTSLPLRINNNGPFTFHYAVWPYVCLFAIIAIVWFFIYLSIIYTRHNRPKTELYRLSFICATQDTTIARTVGGGYETSIVISPLYV